MLSRKFFGALILWMCVSLVGASVGLAATVYLKNGNRIEGEVLERTSDYVKLDISGVTITYYMDEIERIEGAEGSEASQPARPAARRQAPSGTWTPQAPSPTSAPVSDVTPDQKRQLILKYLETSGTKETLDRMFRQMIEDAPPEQSTQLEQIYDLEEIIQVLVPVYSRHLTAEELRELVRFYESPAARKLSEIAPKVMEDTLDAAVLYFQARMPEQLQQPRQQQPAQ